MIVKKILVLVVILIMTSCTSVKQFVGSVNVFKSDSDEDKAIKEMLIKGVEDEVSTIAVEGGFKNNKKVKIKLPDEFLKVEEALKEFKLGTLKKEGLEGLNAAAADAVKEGTPLFIETIEKLKIKEEEQIISGAKNAATLYMKKLVYNELYEEFRPIVQNSYKKVGAANFWRNLLNKHNRIRSVTRVNPDMTDYVTQKALDGMFKMLSIKEEKIRNDEKERDTELLKQVFGK